MIEKNLDLKRNRGRNNQSRNRETIKKKNEKQKISGKRKD